MTGSRRSRWWAFTAVLLLGATPPARPAREPVAWSLGKVADRLVGPGTTVDGLLGRLALAVALGLGGLLVAALLAGAAGRAAPGAGRRRRRPDGAGGRALAGRARLRIGALAAASLVGRLAAPAAGAHPAPSIADARRPQPPEPHDPAVVLPPIPADSHPPAGAGGHTGDPGLPPGSEHIVVPGDCLWDIAAARLGPDAAATAVDRAWRALYDANRDVIGDDPNLILPGQRLRLVPLG